MFFRLFTLLEDDCHRLDLEMAGSGSSTASTDKQAYTHYVALIEKERDLLDEKANLEAQVIWLDQTLSFLTLNASSPTDPASQAVVTAITSRKENIRNIVS